MSKKPVDTTVTDFEDVSEIPREIKVTLQSTASHEESSGFFLKSMVQTIMSHMRLITLLFLIFTLIGAGAAVLYRHQLNSARTYTGVATAVILFGFPEAEEGLDPFGNRLDINEIRSPYVIGQALDYLNLHERGISAEAVRSNLTISRVVPHDVLSRILLIHETAARQPHRLETLEEIVFHSTTHVLELRQSGILNELSVYEINDLLNQIITQYQIFFMQSNNEFYFLDVVVGHFDPSEYDFFDLVRILQGTVNNMLSYTASKQDNAPEFRSPSTGMTFGDIWANLDLINTVDLRSLSALIHVNNMSRNRQRTADILEYQIIRMEVALDIARANADDALFLITDIYQHEQWIFRYMEEYYIHDRKTDVYEDLMRGAFDQMLRVNQLEADIAFYRERLASLRAPEGRAVNRGEVQFVEESIPRLFESLQNWEEIINHTVEDYFYLELFKDAVRTIAPSHFLNASGIPRQQMMFIVLVAGFSGIFLGIMIALYKGDKKQKA